ncbi:MAG: hypothetical protein GY807_10175, partial [Gammaproteobacteria bacterium]|nr:hypothetical protein [Gammaproteobacteria bacterium]
ENVLDVLGNEAAQLTVTRVGIDGAGDTWFAKALGAANTPGKMLEGGVYAPSQLELALHAKLKQRTGFEGLNTMLNPDSDINPRANANFAVDFARTTLTEVEYLPRIWRRSYFFELGLTFTMLDAQGRTVYSREFSRFRLLICIKEGRSACKNVLDGDRIEPVETWHELLEKALDQALLESIAGLQRWAETLRRMKARVVMRRHGETLNLKKDTTYTRNKRLAEYPYLFIDVAPFIEKKLLADLMTRGAKVDKVERKRLKRYLTTTLRSALDQGLRASLRGAISAKQAGIFILPDTRAIWFQDALARVISDAVNAGEFEITIDDEGERMALSDDLQHFGDPCKHPETRKRDDLCLTLSAQYSGSKIKTAKGLKGVQKAQQLGVASALLINPSIDKRKDKKYQRFYPHGIADPKQRILTVSNQSREYLRVIDADPKNNDDYIYLRKVALEIARDLGKNMAKKVVQTFKEEMGR